MKKLILDKLNRMLEDAENKRVDDFIARKLGDNPKVGDIRKLLNKVQENGDEFTKE